MLGVQTFLWFRIDHTRKQLPFNRYIQFLSKCICQKLRLIVTTLLQLALMDWDRNQRINPQTLQCELFHHPAGEVFQRACEQRTEQKGQKRVAEAAAQGVEHEQRAVTVDGAEKAVEEAALFAQAPLGHGAVDHFAAPAERAVGDEEQEKGAEVLKGLRQRQGGQGGHGQYLLYNNMRRWDGKLLYRKSNSNHTAFKNRYFWFQHQFLTTKKQQYENIT